MGAPAGAQQAPGTIAQPRKISSRKPTTFVGGPLLFRAPYPDRRPPYPDYSGGTPFAYVLVFKLNRDPFRNSESRTPSAAGSMGLRA